MKNISTQYQDLKEGKMTQHQFLRNARMLFPNHVTQFNSFEDSVKILKQRGLLNEGDAVKGTPDKAPSYDYPTQPAKYKKVVQEPEVDEQDGIYPATTVTDIPKEEVSKPIKSKKRPDGLEPIKNVDKKNEMKKIRIVKESKKNLTENKVTAKQIQDKYNEMFGKNPQTTFADVAKALGVEEHIIAMTMMAPDLAKNLPGLSEASKGSIKSAAQKGISTGDFSELDALVLGEPLKEVATTPDVDAILKLIDSNSTLKNKFLRIHNAAEVRDFLNDLILLLDPAVIKNPAGLRSAVLKAVEDVTGKKIEPTPTPNKIKTQIPFKGKSGIFEMERINWNTISQKDAEKLFDYYERTGRLPYDLTPEKYKEIEAKFKKKESTQSNILKDKIKEIIHELINEYEEGDESDEAPSIPGVINMIVKTMMNDIESNDLNLEFNAKDVEGELNNFQDKIGHRYSDKQFQNIIDGAVAELKKQGYNLK